MHDLLARNWWALLARGIAALLLGLIALALPGVTLGAMLMIFGIYAIVDGVFSIVAGLRASQRHERWGSLILGGVAGIVAGIIALFAPAAAAIGFVLIVASWAILTGIMQIMAAIRLRRVIENEWLMALGGVISVVLGVLFVLAPGVALLTLVWWLGIFALVSGGVMVALALRLRRGHGGRTASGMA
jgi:uncharacterized membrane protein HdeD (DUF308 family)